MTYRIGLIDARHFARLSHVRIAPDHDEHLILIAGRNAQGKSSILGAIESMLAGAKALPDVPVKVGELYAETKMDLVGDDGVTYHLTRTIYPDKPGSLEIRGPNGIVPKPQTWLDRALGARFLDPLSFDRAEAKVQRKMLLQVAGVDTDKLDNEHERVYARREAEGRDLTKAKGQYASLPAIPQEPAPARSIVEIASEITEVDANTSAVRARLAAVHQAKAAANEAGGRLTRAQDALAAAEREARAAASAATVAATALEEAIAAAGDTDGERHALDVRRLELATELSRSETRARWQATAAAMRTQHDRAKAEVERGEALRAALTEELQAIDTAKAQALAAAAMPVPGLTVTEDGVLFDGLPFKQASQAQRLRASLVISMRLAKEIRVVLVRDGSHLDDDAIEAIRAAAEELDCQAWVERVGVRDPGAIVIENGMVVSGDAS